MPGPRPKPSTIFYRMQIEATRLLSVSYSSSQQDTARKLLALLDLIGRRWSDADEPPSVPKPVKVRKTQAELKQERVKAIRLSAQTAFAEGQPLEATNPYQIGTRDYLLWEGAWHGAWHRHSQGQPIFDADQPPIQQNTSGNKE